MPDSSASVVSATAVLLALLLGIAVISWAAADAWRGGWRARLIGCGTFAAVGVLAGSLSLIDIEGRGRAVLFLLVLSSALIAGAGAGHLARKRNSDN
jgi:hypothetical protein